MKMNAQNDVLELFPWISKSFVQNLLEKSEPNKNLILKSFNAKKCFNDGENFSSYMIGLKVVFRDESEFKEKNRDFLIKIEIQTEENVKISEESLKLKHTQWFCRLLKNYWNRLEFLVKLLQSIHLLAKTC